MRMPAGVADVFPLSPTQAGMVFHTLAEPGTGMYLVQVVYDLRGPLDPDRLGSAIDRLVDRHPMLRTAFVWEGIGKPLQVVREGVAAVVRRSDEPLDELLAKDRALGFDLEGTPAFRSMIVHHGPDHHSLVWTFHHALLDGWSTEILIGELLEIDAGREAGLPDRRPFRDFVAWLGSRDADASRGFWTRELAGFTAPTSLRQDRGRHGAARDHRTVTRCLPEHLAAGLAAFARSHRVTLNTVVQGGWSLLLSRSTGRDDVVFGVTTSGRPPSLDGVEDMVGMFLVTVPSRVRVDERAPLGEWLRALQAANLRRADHQHAPLVDIRRWSELPAGTPLFDSIIVFENVPRRSGGGELAVAGARYLDNSNYPLALIVDPAGGLALKVVADPASYDDAEVERILDRMEALFAGMLATPDGPVGALSLLSAADVAQLAEWSHTRLPRRDERPVHELIETHAASTPAAPAVACGGASLTYAELSARSDALARALRARGVWSGMFVGIHLGRSVDLPVAIVGVLKAGAAYVPLDPSYPQERLRFMMDDAGCEVVVTTPDSPLLAGTTDPVWPGVAVAGKTVATPAAAEPLAYMIYTSGSTGSPNGVPVSHTNLRHSTLAHFAYYERRPETFLLLSSFSFDSSVVGIFWTLCAGGTLVLPADGEELDVQALGRLVEEHRVTHTLCLPSLYRLLLDHAAPRLGSLQVVMVAGEACPADLVEQHFAQLPGAELHNEYGPTEGTVWCTVHRCTQADAAGPVPIGRPVPGYWNLVVDWNGRLAPAGVPGELWIGGPAVTAGYHHRPELTTRRFVERRFEELGAGAPTLWFRTGDVVRRRPDGAVDFLGRADDQVKVRGFRVELGDVEVAIRRHPDIDEAAVLAAGDRLAAYIAGGVAGDDLQAWLRERVPGHMVPGTIVTVDALPRLPNGKVDRAALPALESTERVEVTAPRDDLERTLAGIWAELLPDAEVGVHNDFFQLGGHSILAVALVERIRRVTGKQLRLAALLEAPTVAAQARLVRDDAAAAGRESVVAVKPSGSRPPLFLVPPVAGTALSFHPLAEHLPDDQPLYAFEPVGSDGVAAPQTSIPEMANRYVADLRAFRPGGPYRIGGSCMGAHVAWEMAHQLRAAGEEVEVVVAIDPEAPQHGPGWTTPPRRRRDLVAEAWGHLVRGTLPWAIRRRRERRLADRKLGGMYRAHHHAQTNYYAPPVDVKLLLLQSSENADRPAILERWQRLGRVRQVVVGDVTHRALLEQFQRLAQTIASQLSGQDSGTGRG